ncbi:MAG: 3-deoxy-7-phosphoheptulonate synthase [Firmicutes bacterium]|nr:3-deoxy-7-phosphoheptulonate synthase [Bacillota bacterium]MBQ3931360.1 3-deoxy-7-phosphoheptulonate synthase [Bacillota bacterium]
MIFEEHIPEYTLASRAHQNEDTTVAAGSVKIGAGCPVAVMAGPCAVESAESILRIAGKVKAAGASVLRGGSYKPRTSPYSFQGIGPEGIGWLKEAGRANGMPVISELVSENDLDLFAENVDIIQIGARNMQNFALLKAVGRTQKPVLLKRGAGATIDEWIMAAEYILAAGNPNVILCERGIRTFEYATRNTMDLAVVPIIKEKTHLPIIVDPSHATGNWKYVEAVSLAAIAAGADGLLIEVHDDPDAAVSDGTQSIKPERFAELMEKARLVAKAVGREI